MWSVACGTGMAAQLIRRLFADFVFGPSLTRSLNSLGLTVRITDRRAFESKRVDVINGKKKKTFKRNVKGRYCEWLTYDACTTTATDHISYPVHHVQNYHSNAPARSTSNICRTWLISFSSERYHQFRLRASSTIAAVIQRTKTRFGKRTF